MTKPTVSKRKTEPSGPKTGWSGERALQKNDGAERSGARSGRSWSGKGAESGGYRNRLERAFFADHMLCPPSGVVYNFGRVCLSDDHFRKP